MVSSSNLKIVYRAIIKKNKENFCWDIFPLAAFQEASIMFNIGTIKKDTNTTNDSLAILNNVR